MASKESMGVVAEARIGADGEELVLKSIDAGLLADRSGMRPGDCLRSINGRAISSTDNFREVWGQVKPEENVTFVVDRMDEDTDEVQTLAFQIVVGSQGSVGQGSNKGDDGGEDEAAPAVVPAAMPKLPRCSSQELLSWMHDGSRPLLLLDTRPIAAYRSRHLARALRVDLRAGDATLEAVVARTLAHLPFYKLLKAAADRDHDGVLPTCAVVLGDEEADSHLGALLSDRARSVHLLQGGFEALIREYPDTLCAGDGEPHVHVHSTQGGSSSLSVSSRAGDNSSYGDAVVANTAATTTGADAAELQRLRERLVEMRQELDRREVELAGHAALRESSMLQSQELKRQVAAGETLKKQHSASMQENAELKARLQVVISQNCELYTLLDQDKEVREAAQTIRAHAAKLLSLVAEAEESAGGLGEEGASAQAVSREEEALRLRVETQELRALMQKARAEASELRERERASQEQLRSLQQQLDARRGLEAEHSSALASLEEQLRQQTLLRQRAQDGARDVDALRETVLRQEERASKAVAKWQMLERHQAEVRALLEPGSAPAAAAAAAAAASARGGVENEATGSSIKQPNSVRKRGSRRGVANGGGGALASSSSSVTSSSSAPRSRPRLTRSLSLRSPPSKINLSGKNGSSTPNSSANHHNTPLKSPLKSPRSPRKNPLVSRLARGMGCTLKDHRGHGVQVTSVSDGGPAHSVGVLGGDIILRVGGKRTHNLKELAAQATSCHAKVILSVERNNMSSTRVVFLAEPEPPSSSSSSASQPSSKPNSLSGRSPPSRLRAPQSVPSRHRRV